jgi:hypothetical protein
MAHELLPFRSRALALTGACLGLVACGGAAAPAPQSTQAPAARLTELDALERDFDVSAEQLQVQLRRRESPKDAADDADEAVEKKQEEAASSATPAPAPPPAPSANASATADAEYATIGGPCDLMCRALSSMRRSAGGICSLAGDQHERCLKARSRWELSERQVQQSGCACSG